VGTVEENWDNLPETLRFDQPDAVSFFNHLDIDGNGLVGEEEACFAMIEKRYACIYNHYIEEFDWRMDYNGDGYVTLEEYNRAFGD